MPMETNTDKPLDIAVIGAGAAGMVAAIFAAENGAKVTLFDKNERAGRKLGLTGKGRCNLTNNCPVNGFIESVQRNPRFLYTAASAFTPQDVMAFFENELGVPLKTERGDRVFPCSDRAGDIVYALVKKTRSLGIGYQVGSVESVAAENGTVAGIHKDGKLLPFDRVIVCTGGASYPSTGSTGDGTRFASELGLDVLPFRPSLIPLTTVENCAEMMGLSLKNTGLRLFDTEKNKTVYEDMGEMLFTHFGVSGPMILSASAHLPDLSGCKPGRFRIELDLKPALDEQTLDARLLRDFAAAPNKDLGNALGGLLPQKMIPVMIRRSGINGRTKVNALTREQRKTLVELLKCFPLTVKGVRPIDEAIISAGGVSVKELDPRTMECKKIRGLYFAGETVDVDAYTGGFNLQIAFCTGRLAGISAAAQ